MHRRNMLKAATAFAGLLVLAPLRALAAVWNNAAFEAASPESAMQGLGLRAPQPSPHIGIVAPDFAENGAIVQIEVESRIPATEAIAITVVDHIIVAGDGYYSFAENRVL